MKFRYLICHREPNNVGSLITRRVTLRRAKTALEKLQATITTKIGIWDNQENKWL